MKKKRKNIDKRKMVAIFSLVMAGILLLTLLAGIIPVHNHSHVALPLW